MKYKSPIWGYFHVQQIFHCAAENTGQTIEGFRTGLVEGFPSLLIHLNGANEALRVEFSTFLKLYVELRASQGNWLLGRFISIATWELRANSGTSRTRLHTATGAAFPAPGLRAY